jgi:hypothetical protein
LKVEFGKQPASAFTPSVSAAGHLPRRQENTMSEIQPYAEPRARELDEAIGGARRYWIMKMYPEYLPDVEATHFPWVLYPAPRPGYPVRFTNADRAMDAAEMWERDEATFLTMMQVSRVR